MPDIHQRSRIYNKRAAAKGNAKRRQLEAKPAAKSAAKQVVPAAKSTKETRLHTGQPTVSEILAKIAEDAAADDAMTKKVSVSSCQLLV